MFGFIKKIFIGLLTSIFNASNHTKMHIVKQSDMYDSTYSY